MKKVVCWIQLVMKAMVEHLAQRGKRRKPKRKKLERCAPHPYRLHHPSKRWRGTALLTDHIVHGVRTMCEERVEQTSIGNPARRMNGRGVPKLASDYSYT